MKIKLDTLIKTILEEKQGDLIVKCIENQLKEPTIKQEKPVDILLTNIKETNIKDQQRQNKLRLVKYINEITKTGLNEAKNLVDTMPSIILKTVPHSDALIFKQKLEMNGAFIELIEST